MVAATAMLLAACSSGSSSGGSSESPAPTAPTITTMNVKSDVQCSSGEVPVKVMWETENAQSAAISVDGSQSATDLAASGKTKVNVKCTDGTHEITLTATNAAGETATDTHTIKTDKAPPAPNPTIKAFNVVAGQCQGKTLQVTAQYATANATSVEFEVDGQAPGAQAGLDTSGTANVPDVPCDGKSHQITLVATNAANQSAQATQSVSGAAVPVITGFSVNSQVHCSSGEVPVKVAWQTTGAKSTTVTVDGAPAAKDQPPTGSTQIQLPCEKSTVKVGLIASASDGKQASVVHNIAVIPSGGQVKPTINSFSLNSTGCVGKTVNVKATYSTSNAEAVSFEIDGVDPGMQAGLPTSGKANVPGVLCNGKSHQITLVATGANNKSVQQTQSVGPLYATNPNG